MKVRFLSVAEKELRDAFDWYESQTPGLGNEFLVELDQAVMRIRRYPKSCPATEDGMRRALLNRFRPSQSVAIIGMSTGNSRHGFQRNLSARSRAARIASAMIAICGFTPRDPGITEPSIMCRLGTSWVSREKFTTEVLGSAPIAHVPTG